MLKVKEMNRENAQERRVNYNFKKLTGTILINRLWSAVVLASARQYANKMMAKIVLVPLGRKLKSTILHDLCMLFTLNVFPKFFINCMNVIKFR